ncbi:MAG: hypothetical protein HPY78_06565 [Brevinematales bacterium]|nr:hypothetical protein [Brevinematales bacterium]
MKRSFLFFFSLVAVSAVLFSCQKKVKPEEPVVKEVGEPTPEEEAKIKLVINFDGKWQRGSKAIIVITGKKGRIIARNGAEIPIVVRYLNEKTVKILEEEYTVEYLVNWLPKRIAQQLVQTKALRAYSILEIIDENTLKGTVYGWNVIHNNEVVQDIQPYVSAEEWKRIP